MRAGVVDAITAEDIGKFPDTNLAESIQRIPGVTIDRMNNEGSRVTVRGFGPEFNLVTLNGRSMPGNIGAEQLQTASRSFDFENLSADGISGITVYKTGRADMRERRHRLDDQHHHRASVRLQWDAGDVLGQGDHDSVDPSRQQGHAGILRPVQRHLLRRPGGLPDQRLLFQAQQPGAEREHRRLAAEPIRLRRRSAGVNQLQHESRRQQLGAAQ